MLREIVAILEAAGLGQFGKDIFIQFMPADVTNGILLLLELPGLSVDPEVPGKHKGRFQAVVRGTDYLAVEAKAAAVSDALATQQRKQAGDWLFDWIIPQHLPFPFPRTEGNVQEFTVNFVVSANKINRH